MHCSVSELAQEMTTGDWDPDIRIRDQERDGVHAEVIFPTAGMALCAEHYCDDTQALYANLRSFNARLMPGSPTRRSLDPVFPRTTCVPAKGANRF